MFKTFLLDVWNYITLCGFVIGTFMIPLAMFVFVVGTPLHLAEKKSCYDKTESFESRHSFWQGCQVKVNDRWVDWSNFRVTDIEE